jgi:hypothetical protein
MTSLALRLQKYFVSTSMGAVATLQRVADESGMSVSGGQRLDITIPANPDGGAYRVDVAPGHWLVEATLPSGEVITEEVAVAKGQNLSVTLHAAEQSPHEWLGWQHLVGNIEGNKTLYALHDKAGGALEAMRQDSVFRSTAGADEASAGVPAPKVNLCKKHGEVRGAPAWTKILAPDPSGFVPCSPTEEDPAQATWLYRLEGPPATPQRHFAHVESAGERFAVSLPLPWETLGNHGRAPAQVMVHKHPTDGSVHIGVIVEDPDFAPMAGLMTASTLPKAAIAVKQASEMLFGKMLHPLGAAAGGYVLLAAGDSKQQHWHEWIDNLANWFPSIPDGAILQASLRLRFPKNEHSSAEARAALLQAFDRGIPYYSAGVLWLLDGLTVFAEEPGVNEMMRTVQRVAHRLDLSQAFTVIRISDPVKR